MMPSRAMFRRGVPSAAALVAVAAVLLGAGCSAANGPASSRQLPVDGQAWTLPDSRVDEFRRRFATFQSYSGAETRDERVVRTSDAWDALWAQLSQGRTPVPAIIPVDFASEMVVYVAMGAQSTGGHSIRIRSVVGAEGKLWVDVEERVPGDRCITTQALTQPTDAVPVPRSDAEVVFVRTRIRIDC